MELIQFSVTNFRSITKAHKVSVSDMTVLLGKNNEGKSNLLKALDIGMRILQLHAYVQQRRPGLWSQSRTGRNENMYFWERDFPISLQNRTTASGTQTLIRLEFSLDTNEVSQFRKETKSKLNGTLPIVIKIGRNNVPIIAIAKGGRGSKTLNAKSDLITEFVANKISFNYIPAVRTDQEALDVVSEMLSDRLRELESDDDYISALQTIKQLQDPILKELSESIKQPLTEFLPTISDVAIEISERNRRLSVRRDFEVIIDDGTPTNLAFKGDGVKSLAALGLLKSKLRVDGASIIAIEEPESHLHPAAIHQLNSVIKSLTTHNQVILSTHNPLFVDRHNIKSNIVVDSGKASPARSVKQIRDLLGIKASDNLINASYVLIVEGSDDVISLRVLLGYLSDGLKKQLNNNMLVVEEIGGAGNLSYKLSTLKNSLCVYHSFLDFDKAGISAFEAAEKNGLISTKQNTFITVNGSPESEFEDCLNLAVYRDEIIEQFGVDLNHPSFRGNAKWSERVKLAFISQGKLWNNRIQSEVKYAVAMSVKNSPESALNPHKSSAVDALVRSLEELLKV